MVGRSCTNALLLVLKNIKEVRVYDLNRDAAQSYCDELKKNFHVKAVAADSIEQAVRDADVVNVVTSGAVSPKIEDEWLKEGVLLSLPASADISKKMMCESTILVDNWKMYEAYANELRDEPGGYATNLSGICGYMMDLGYGGEIAKDSIVNLGDVVAGKAAGRKSDKERVIYIMDGMPVEDVAWGYEIYQNAQRLGLGTKLNLWGDR